MEGNNQCERRELKFSLILNKSLIDILSDNLFLGYDCKGGYEDLILFDESPECGIYESIRNIESIKHLIKREYLKHLTIVSNILNCDVTTLDSLEDDLEYESFESNWYKKIQCFYKNIISITVIFDNIDKYGVKLEHIETILEMIQKVEDYNLDNLQIISDSIN